MCAEQRDFQSASPTEQTAHSQADQSQICFFAGDRIDATHSISSRWDGSQADDFRPVGDAVRIVTRSIEKLREILNKFRALVTVRSSSIGGALIVAFGLGWACASIFSNPDARLIRLEKVDLSLEKPDSEKDVRRNHRIANAAVPPNPAFMESNKPKLSASAASTRLISSVAVQVHAEPRSILPQSMQQERTSPSRALSASSDPNPLLPLSPVPETKPTTIAGWTVREVYGENAVLVGPDHVWTVRAGDTVPGVGRIDTIVRWGSRWIVATTAGLISTE
jgi:hypothetical protein